LKNGVYLSNHDDVSNLSKGNVTLTFDKVVRKENGFVPGIKLFSLLSDAVTSVLETKKLETIDVKGMVMRLLASLMSLKLVQLENQGRKISTKSGKEEFQSVESVFMLTLVQSKELAWVDLNFGH
jgi:hypothetical protein